MESEKPTKNGHTSEDPEKQTAEKLPYPKQIGFIIVNEFCERFSYYGMRTVLTRYINEFLGINKALTLLIYHLFVAGCYYSPLIGAYLADGFLGKFRTIFYISILYAIGQWILTFGALGGSSAQILSFVGLFVIALGTGGIKPCVVSFGAEQFKLPEQEAMIGTYFALFYASINSGSLLSTALTPILKKIECQGEDTCYPLAFGVPAVMMVVATLIFLAGKLCNLYKIEQPKENVIAKFTSCIWNRFDEKKFGAEFVKDCKAALNVLWMFLPFPVIWALYELQGSKWVFQAKNLNGVITKGFIFEPEQMQIVNPVLIIVFLPIFEKIVYPLCAKCKLLTTPLQKIVTGGVLIGAAILVSGFLELAMQEYYPEMPESGQTRIGMYNGLPLGCQQNMPPINLKYIESDIKDQTFNFNFTENNFVVHEIVPNQGKYKIDPFEVKCDEELTVKFAETEIEPLEEEEDVVPNMAILVTYDLEDPKKGLIKRGDFNGPIAKTDDGYPDIKFIFNVLENVNVTIKNRDEDTETWLNSTQSDTKIIHLKDIFETTFQVQFEDSEDFEAELEQDLLYGANYQVVIIQHEENVTIQIDEITSENHYHVAMMIPQLILITAGEVLFSVQALQFAFSQAPLSMKAVMQSGFTLTSAVGNTLDAFVLVSLEDAFSSDAYLYFLLTGIIWLVMGILAVMSMRYKYVDYTGKDEKDQ